MLEINDVELYCIVVNCKYCICDILVFGRIDKNNNILYYQNISHNQTRPYNKTSYTDIVPAPPPILTAVTCCIVLSEYRFILDQS